MRRFGFRCDVGIAGCDSHCSDEGERIQQYEWYDKLGGMERCVVNQDCKSRRVEPTCQKQSPIERLGVPHANTQTASVRKTRLHENR